MPYSWGAETPLSNFEIRLDDATRPRQDPAITVAFALEPRDGDPGPLKILGLDDDAVDAAIQPGPGRRPRHRATQSSKPQTATHVVLAEAAVEPAMSRETRRARAGWNESAR